MFMPILWGTQKRYHSPFFTRGPEAERVKGKPKVTQVVSGGAGNHTRAMDLLYYTVSFSGVYGLFGMLVVGLSSISPEGLWIGLHHELGIPWKNSLRTGSSDQVPFQLDYSVAPALLHTVFSLCLSSCSCLQTRKPPTSPCAETFPVPESTWPGSFPDVISLSCKRSSYTVPLCFFTCHPGWQSWIWETSCHQAGDNFPEEPHLLHFWVPLLVLDQSLLKTNLLNLTSTQN